jgi:hypothetical protein
MLPETLLVTQPPGSELVCMLTGGFTTTESGRSVVAPTLSVPRIVKLKLPALLYVPDIAEPESEIPGGSEPDCKL